MKLKSVRIISYVTIIIALSINSAFAYLDPGTGSFIFQALIAGFVGTLFIIKKFWKNITGFFRNLFNKREQND